MIRSFKDLEVYKESYDLAIIINKLCNKLPLYEKLDLGSQMRRCSKSPPANIAEGWAKKRMEVHLNMARDLDYLNKDICNELIARYILLGGKITNLRNKWKSY